MQGGVSTCQAMLKTRTVYRLHNALPTQACGFWEATGQNQEVARATTDTVAQKSDQLQIHTSARGLCSAQGRGTALKGSSRLSGGTGRTWCAIACLLKPQPKDGTRGTQGSARRGTPHEKWADV